MCRRTATPEEPALPAPADPLGCRRATDRSRWSRARFREVATRSVRRSRAGLRGQEVRLLALSDRVEQVVEGAQLRRSSSSGLSLLSSLGAEHHLVVIGVGDGPPHICPSHSEHLLGHVGRFGSERRSVSRGAGRNPGWRRRPAVGLVREVAVWRRGAHACTSGDLPKREAFRPLLADQPQRRLSQRPLQITVVIGVALLG